MAKRHDQKPDRRHMTCSNCHKGECEKCVDTARIRAGFADSLCQCQRRDHAGEPIAQQVSDPFTGEVHAPGLRVTLDGQVIRK